MFNLTKKSRNYTLKVNLFEITIKYFLLFQNRLFISCYAMIKRNLGVFPRCRGNLSLMNTFQTKIKVSKLRAFENWKTQKIDLVSTHKASITGAHFTELQIM